MLDIEPKPHRPSIEYRLGEKGIFKRGSRYFATADGKHAVPVAKDLAENISIALRVQEKVDEALMAGHRPGFLKTVAMLNCRKSIRAISGSSLRQLVEKKDNSMEDSHEEKRKRIDQMSGVPEMMSDVGRLLSMKKAPVLGSRLDMHIAEHLDHHPEDLPAVVHVFDIPQKRSSQILRKMMAGASGLSVEDAATLHRNHSFLVLGKTDDGTYLCFHKQGPSIDHRFELQKLDSILLSALATSHDPMHLSFVGPIAREEAKEGA